MEDKEINHVKILAQASRAIIFLSLNGFMTNEEHRLYLSRINNYGEKYKVSKEEYETELNKLR